MPGDGVYVFDACAVIALLQEEPGAAAVEALLEDESHRCLIHVLNVCEIYYDLFRRDGEEIAAGVEEYLTGYGFKLNDTMSSELWQAAGKLKAQWRRVSLADCFALALAIQKKAPLVTSDHHEFDPVAEAGLSPIHFIR
ncbi:MAG: type II toxin-antitoxin system VapC family toxin [bacterium]|nr:type II toxin-antitoxin system VapC family toxin [bacterium]